MSWQVDSVDLVGAFLMYSDHKRRSNFDAWLVSMAIGRDCTRCLLYWWYQVSC